MQDLDSLAQSATKQSILYHRAENFVQAAEASELALDAWIDRPALLSGADEPNERDREAYLKILNLAITQQFNLGKFAYTLVLLDEAKPLAAVAPPSFVTAGVAWSAAAVEQLRGYPQVALAHALRASTIYATLATPIEQARLHLFVARLAMDCAVSSAAVGAYSLRDQYLDLASKHLHSAEPPSDLPFPESIEGHYRLVRAIYSRLAGINENRIDRLLSVADLAWRIEDPILYGQACTAIGDQFMAFGAERESANTWYRWAIDVLEKSQAPAFKVWPLRALKRDWEWRTD